MPKPSNFTFFVKQSDATDLADAVELKRMLESSDDKVKLSAMRQIVSGQVNGESPPGILMHLIRFVLPSKNKVLKKLLLLFFENHEHVDESGRLKQEMILVW